MTTSEHVPSQKGSTAFGVFCIVSVACILLLVFFMTSYIAEKRAARGLEEAGMNRVVVHDSALGKDIFTIEGQCVKRLSEGYSDSDHHGVYHVVCQQDGRQVTVFKTHGTDNITVTSQPLGAPGASGSPRILVDSENSQTTNSTDAKTPDASTSDSNKSDSSVSGSPRILVDASKSSPTDSESSQPASPSPTNSH